MSTLFSILLAASIIATICFSVMLITRTIRKRGFKHTGKALLCAVTICVISFIGIGVTYEPSEKEEGSIANPETPIEAATENGHGEQATQTPPTENHTPEPTKEATEEPTREPALKATPFPVPEAVSTPVEPSSEPLQAEEPDYDAMFAALEDKVRANILSAIEGKFDTEIEASITINQYNGYVLIKAQASDSLTTSLIRKSMIADIRDVLSEVDTAIDGFSFLVNGEDIPIYGIEKVGFNLTFPMADAYGKLTTPIVLKAEYSKETIEAVAWENKYAVNFEAIADDFWIAPAFNEKD